MLEGATAPERIPAAVVIICIGQRDREFGSFRAERGGSSGLRTARISRLSRPLPL